MDKQDWQNKGAGHRKRLREKFLELGIEAFTNQEVIELLLTLGTPQKDCKEIARNALGHFGSLPAVLSASPAELQQIKGIGPINGFAIHFVHGVARSYLKHRIEGKNYLRSSKEVSEYLIHSMRDLEHEIFKVIFLDADHGIITTEIITEGTITANTIYPREVIKSALKYNAAAMIIAHNHPSGNNAPSPEDKRLTRSMHLTCALMNIRLLDHLIIAGSDTPFSFADNGLMESLREECASILTKP